MMPDTKAPSQDKRHEDIKAAVARLMLEGYRAEELRRIAHAYGMFSCVPPVSAADVDALLDEVMLRAVQSTAGPKAPELEPIPLDAYVERISSDLDFDQRPVVESKPNPSPQRILDLATLADTPVPEFEWWIPGWLSPHPTLLAGRGGTGKSLLALQIAVARAAGVAFIGPAAPPQTVLYWACEDDAHELHRRLYRICAAFRVDMRSIADRLIIDARLGLENTLLTTEFGRPMWTGLIDLAREQVNDFASDIWILDNIAHVYAASENDRSSVTKLVSGITGLRDTPYCPLLLGHVAKAQGSEYAGSTAWENAVRMRWFLGRHLPDQEGEDDDDGNSRVLAKRKSNYAADDLIRFTLQDGVLVRQEASESRGGVIDAIRQRNVLEALLNGMDLLAKRGIYGSEKPAANYLPALLKQYGVDGSHTKKELARAMYQAIKDGQIRRDVVGKNANRMPREGLVRC